MISDDDRKPDGTGPVSRDGIAEAARMAALGKLTLGELLSARSSAEYLVRIGGMQGVLDQGLMDRLITLHAALEHEVTARAQDEQAGRAAAKGPHRAVSASY